MNDNKSAVMNNAAVQQLRKVPGFDPMKLLRKTISVKTGHPVWKLDLRYKRLWFRLACPNGRMLLKPLRISDQLAIIEAQVYFDKGDPVPAASFTSEQHRENVPGGEFLRAAREDALNMALENAGFGIQLPCAPSTPRQAQSAAHWEAAAITVLRLHPGDPAVEVRLRQAFSAADSSAWQAAKSQATRCARRRRKKTLSSRSRPRRLSAGHTPTATPIPVRSLLPSSSGRTPASLTRISSRFLPAP